MISAYLNSIDDLRRKFLNGLKEKSFHQIWLINYQQMKLEPLSFQFVKPMLEQTDPVIKLWEMPSKYWFNIFTKKFYFFPSVLG